MASRKTGWLRAAHGMTAPAVVAALIAGCGSSAKPPIGSTSASGNSTSPAAASAADRIKSPCKQISVATLNAAFGTTFDPGTADNTFPDSPACNWTSKTLDLSLSLYPALATSYDDELNDTSDTATYKRTQPKFGDDSTFSVDTVLPETTTLSVLDDDLEWVIDADSKGTGDGRPGLLALATTLF